MTLIVMDVLYNTLAAAKIFKKQKERKTKLWHVEMLTKPKPLLPRST